MTATLKGSGHLHLHRAQVPGERGRHPGGPRRHLLRIGATRWASGAPPARSISRRGSCIGELPRARLGHPDYVPHDERRRLIVAQHTLGLSATAYLRAGLRTGAHPGSTSRSRADTLPPYPSPTDIRRPPVDEGLRRMRALIHYTAFCTTGATRRKRGRADA